MKFTIRPKQTNVQRGYMSATARDAREALNIVRQMIGDGRADVEILAADGTPYDLVELERLTSEEEKSE